MKRDIQVLPITSGAMCDNSFSCRGKIAYTIGTSVKQLGINTNLCTKCMKQIADTIPGELLVDNLYVKSLIEQSKNDLSDLDVESLPIVIELRNKLSEMNMKAMNDSAKLNQPKAIPPKTTPTKSTGNGGKKR